jgi:hypothetical protein
MTHTVMEVGQPVDYSHPIPGDWTINLLIKAVYESESGRDRPFQAAPHVARGCGLKGTVASRLRLIHCLD